jgi:hypothetical protein
MSEQAPRPMSNRLEQLAANREAKAAEKYEQALYGDAGTPANISDAAEQRIHEADAYQAHLAKLAERSNKSLLDDTYLAGEDRRSVLDFQALNEEPSPGLDQQRNEAYADHQLHEEQAQLNEHVAQEADAILEAKLASDPTLRRLDLVSRQVETARNTLVDADTDSEDAARLKRFEDKLQDLLTEYSKSDDYDEALADVFIDRSDMKALDIAAQNALNNARESAESIPSTADDTQETIDATDEEVIDAEIVDEEPVKVEQGATDADIIEVDVPDDEEPQGDPQQIQDTLATRVKTENGNDATDAAAKAQEAADVHSVATMSVNGEALGFNPKYKADSGRFEKFIDHPVTVTREGFKRLQERWKNREKLSGKKRGLLGLGAIALFATIVTGSEAINSDHDAHADKPATPETSLPSRGGGHEPTEPNHNQDILHSTAWDIPKGSGGEALMNRLHVDKGVWYANEDEFLKKFPDEAYRMNDRHVGFDNPGTLSPAAKQFWANASETQQK